MQMIVFLIAVVYFCQCLLVILSLQIGLFCSFLFFPAQLASTSLRYMRVVHDLSSLNCLILT